MTHPIPTGTVPLRPFTPSLPLRNPHLQTILASLKIRAPGENPLRAHSEQALVDGGRGVRLVGCRTARPPGSSRGLAILLHGWEGSAESTYMLTTGGGSSSALRRVPPQPGTTAGATPQQGVFPTARGSRGSSRPS
jgi:predicted alpha/beta-fold hydrolase